MAFLIPIGYAIAAVVGAGGIGGGLAYLITKDS